MRPVNLPRPRHAHVSIWGVAISALLFAAPGYAAATASTPASASPPATSAQATPRPCKRTAKKQWISVHLSPPSERTVSAVNIRVDYPDGMLSIPGKDNDEKVVARIGRLPASAITAVTDLRTALRVVIGKSPKLPAGEVFTVEFDRCEGAARATAEDFHCSVETAANSSGQVNGASCAVIVP